MVQQAACSRVLAFVMFPRGIVRFWQLDFPGEKIPHVQYLKRQFMSVIKPCVCPVPAWELLTLHGSSGELARRFHGIHQLST